MVRDTKKGICENERIEKKSLPEPNETELKQSRPIRNGIKKKTLLEGRRQRKSRYEIPEA